MVTASSCILTNDLLSSKSIGWLRENPNFTHDAKHHPSLLSLCVALRIIRSTTSTKCLLSAVDTLFISVRIQRGTAHDEGGKFQHHHVLVSLDPFSVVYSFFFCLKVLGRTKHLAPDTSRPVTHLVDRPGDRGKDRWMENSMAGRREGRGGQIL